MSSCDRKAVNIMVLKWVTVLLLLKVLFSIFSNYRDYFPPNFDADFLIGRELYFFGAYSLAFYVHILTTPCALLSGLVLMSEDFRRRFPARHRLIGKLHVTCILLLVVPSSLWMSAYAYSGRVAGLGFATLSVTTGLCVGMGWLRAIERNFKKHRYWMIRCFAMLCSAVVLRLFSGLATVLIADAAWTYPLAAWAVWVVPLCGLELIEHFRQRQTV